MSYFGCFYLDKEKDIVVTLHRIGDELSFVLRTPNHGTGNLITNLAKLCDLPVSYDVNGMKIIKDKIPCYIDGENHPVYVLRLANTKVANIYPDGTVERKAYVPAIAKTLMSQTKDYQLDFKKTLVKTFIRSEVKFHADLHTHRSANLSPDILIAMGIHHQIRYPYYYVKKLELKLTEEQRGRLEAQRLAVAETFRDCGLTGKYLERKIDDNTEINFADLILENIGNSSYNIPRIRASLAIMKDGQAVFTNVEKVYLYRYVFTKPAPAKERIQLQGIERIPDQDIVRALQQMQADRVNPIYVHNTFYQDKLLWVARSYQKMGVTYAEISDTALVKRSDAARTLQEIHEIMPAITEETGVTLRFLAAFRRIPLTIVKNEVEKDNYFRENLQVLRAVADDPYVAGSDIVGEELNDICDLKGVISSIVEIAGNVPSFVVRIHAGENDSLPDNVYNSIMCVERALAPGQHFPHMRVGHGLYTADLETETGKKLIEKLKEHDVVLEFQITSNVRLNNISRMDHHPLKQYLHAGIACVQGTDGGALYGTDSIDEQLSLERILELSFEEMLCMHRAEETIVSKYMQEFAEKTDHFDALRGELSPEKYVDHRINEEEDSFRDLEPGARQYPSEEALKERILPLPEDRVPIVIAGGSFNNAGRMTEVVPAGKALLDELIEKADPNKVCFVIGPSMSGYERYVLEHAKDRFPVYAFVPSVLTEAERDLLLSSGASIRVSIEAAPMGVYKSFAFEIYKRRNSVTLALDGNSAAANLIQDALNRRYKSRIFINTAAQVLKAKADSLQGYVTLLEEGHGAAEILGYVDRYHEKLKRS